MKAYTVPPEPPRVKLDANESPWPLPAEATRAIADAVAALPYNRYPDGRARGLRAALARRLDADPEALVLGAGSDEIITILMNALSHPADGRAAAVLFPGPSFVMYGITAKNHGLRPIDVDLRDDFSLDVDAMRAAFARERPSLAFYATPNNPTGNAFDEDALRTLISENPDTVHVIDEAYGTFHRDAPRVAPRTLRSWTSEFPQVAVMGTLSKVGLAALRVGWLQAHPVLTGELEKVRQPFNLNAPAQEAARLLLEDFSEVLEERTAQIVAERERLAGALTAAGFECMPSQANFVLSRIPRARRETLLERGVAIRFFADPRLEGYARVTVGTPEETDALLAALV